MFDLGPAADDMRRLVAGVRDDHLAEPTPCADWRVADLLAHVHQFTTVFTANAVKQPVRPPSTLVDDWRDAIPTQLGRLAEAWRDEDAWQGRTSAGGVEMAAADNAVVAIEELTLHGWDLARATDQSIEIGDAQLDLVDPFFVIFAVPLASGRGPFGPAVTVSGEASRLDQLLARAGRAAEWHRHA